MKKKISIVLAVLMFTTAMLFITGCNRQPEQSGTEKEKIFTDSLGRTVSVSSFEKTAVLSGSLAEIWAFAGGEIYGVTTDAYSSSTAIALVMLAASFLILFGVNLIQMRNAKILKGDS